METKRAVRQRSPLSRSPPSQRPGTPLAPSTPQYQSYGQSRPGTGGSSFSQLNTVSPGSTRPTTAADAELNQVLPHRWQERSVEAVNRSMEQRKELAEYRAAYHRYNEQSRREQYALTVQVNDALKAKQSTLDGLMMKLQDCHAQSAPVVQQMKATLVHHHVGRDCAGESVWEVQSTLEAELADKKALVEWNMRRVAIRNERFDAPGEMVVDEPQRLLLAQQAFLKDTIVQHETDHAEVAGLFGLLEASGWELEQDLADKKRASELNLQAESECRSPLLTLPPKSPGSARADLTAGSTVQLDRDVAVVVEQVDLPTLASPNQWAGATLRAIDKNQRCQIKSLAMCDGVELVCRQLNESVDQTEGVITTALRERIKEQKVIVDELREQLTMTKADIRETQATVAMLAQALEDLQVPLNVAERRLQIHQQRPRRELIEDEVQLGLKGELNALRHQQALLEQRKLKVEGMLHGLSATAEEMQSELTRMESAATLDVRVLEMTSFPPAPPPTDAASSRPGTAASASTAVSHL